MNLIIDIGNTCAKLLAFENGQPIEEIRADNGDMHPIDDFCSKYDFEKGIYSTVIDLSADVLRKLDNLPFKMMKLAPTETPVPITNLYKSPATLGSDRLAAAVSANYLKPHSDILIIDVGTCITYDFVNCRGEYLGGNISPGLTMRLRSLNAFTDKLPLVKREGLSPDFGFDTETAIRSGVMSGVRYEIEGYIKTFLSKYPQLFVYLTGGVHLNLHISEKNRIFANEFIVPIGLNRILEYNNESL